MKLLRNKGSSLPIFINIQNNCPKNLKKAEYSINKKKTDFDFIKEFLFFEKTDYIPQLDSNYKQKNL